MTRFLLKNRDYFLSHSLSSLPLQFIERIGEIEECEYNKDAFSIFSTFESIISDAKEYVWLMADYPYGGVDVIDSNKMRHYSENISWRAVLPYAVGKTIEWKNVSYIKNKKENVEIRLLKDIHIPVGLAMNERLAKFSIANLDGKLDLNIGFKGDNPSFHKWCHDLFLFYWSIAKRMTGNM
jgi:predicted transcriptional regulator